MAHEQSASNDSLDYDRIGRFIYSFHRVCGSPEALVETTLTRNAPPDLAQRAARLAQKFHRIVKNPASSTESEIDSTLREASEVQTEISKWPAGASKP